MSATPGQPSLGCPTVGVRVAPPRGRVCAGGQHDPPRACPKRAGNRAGAAASTEVPALAAGSADAPVAAGPGRWDLSTRRPRTQDADWDRRPLTLRGHRNCCWYPTVERSAKRSRPRCAPTGCPLRRSRTFKQFTGRFTKPRPAEVLFERVCRENGITARLTKPRSPTTTGKLERWHSGCRLHRPNGEPRIWAYPKDVSLHAMESPPADVRSSTMSPGSPSITDRAPELADP